MRLIRSLLIFLCASPLAAQTAVVADATVRSAPDGGVVAVLKQGTTVTVGHARNGFVYITFTGWVDGSKLGGSRDSFPAHLTGAIAMRLRSAPSMKGAILGEVRPNAGLFTGDKQASWMSVRRGGWIDAKALPRNAAAAASAPKPAPRAETPPAKVTTAKGKAAPTKAAPAPTKLAPKKSATARPVVEKPMASTTPAPETAASVEAAPLVEPLPPNAMRVPRSTVVRNAPNGVAVGQLGAGTYVVPLARSRGWVRVRAEFWVPEREVIPADSSFGASLTAADLRADPEGTRGKTVRWEVQVLALQYADPLRRDLAEGEPYFLAKGPATEDQLLYLAIPPSLISEGRATQPLTRLLITARVRTGRSQPVGIPILDLISFSRP